MDIDSPPASDPNTGHSGHTHFPLPEFSLSFPLPFRVLFLVGFAILLWAINLHVLHLLGVDVTFILDFRDTDSLPTGEAGAYELVEVDNGDDVDLTPTPERRRRRSPIQRPGNGTLHGPVYRLVLVYTLWVGGGWVLYRWLSGGDEEGMEQFRGLVGVVLLGAVVGGIVPWRGIGERERRGLRKCLKRIFFPSPSSPIYFSDVILADILTSFAKVLGDLFVSASQIWYGGITHGRVRQYGWSNCITLGMVCLPYTLRLRQCLFELHQSHYTSSRPLLNALKYFSAFPVIILSALQKTLLDEITQSAGKGISPEEIADSRWHGEHRLFRVWLLAVAVNSIFSFYWDVQMDWGLRLCEVDTWFPKRGSRIGSSPRIGGRGVLGGFKRIWTREQSTTGNHHRSPHPTPSLPSTHVPSSPLDLVPSIAHFGLRPTLLFDPLTYHLFTLLDLVLRFTWSLKLSSHLHTISEIESGVFMMEGLELVRRWMWVFVRIEWEGVKMREGQKGREGLGLGDVGRGEGGQVLWDGEKERR